MLIRDCNFFFSFFFQFQMFPSTTANQQSTIIVDARNCTSQHRSYTTVRTITLVPGQYFPAQELHNSADRYLVCQELEASAAVFNHVHPHLASIWLPDVFSRNDLQKFHQNPPICQVCEKVLDFQPGLWKKENFAWTTSIPKSLCSRHLYICMYQLETEIITISNANCLLVLCLSGVVVFFIYLCSFH